MDRFAAQVLDAVRAVGDMIVLPAFEARPQVERKDDGSVVTATDRTAEAALADALRAIADAPVFGEEAISENPALLWHLAAVDRAWIIDPINGTKQFSTGDARFSILVVWAIRSEPVASWIVQSRPRSPRRRYPRRGHVEGRPASPPPGPAPRSPTSSTSPPASRATAAPSTTSTAVGRCAAFSPAIIGRAAGLLLFALLAVYVLWTYRTEQAGAAPQAETDLRAAQAASRSPMGIGLWGDIVVAAAGLALILAGADLLVESAVEIARDLSVSETVVGLTIVAAGTSLPELAAGLAAARKRQGDVLLGNIIGSSIFNVLGILGVTAPIAPIPVDLAIAQRDAWVAAAALMLVLFARTGWRIGRREASLLLAAYTAYLWLILV